MDENPTSAEPEGDAPTNTEDAEETELAAIVTEGAEESANIIEENEATNRENGEIDEAEIFERNDAGVYLTAFPLTASEEEQIAAVNVDEDIIQPNEDDPYMPEEQTALTSDENDPAGAEDDQGTTDEAHEPEQEALEGEVEETTDTEALATTNEENNVEERETEEDGTQETDAVEPVIEEVGAENEEKVDADLTVPNDDSMLPDDQEVEVQASERENSAKMSDSAELGDETVVIEPESDQAAQEMVDDGVASDALEPPVEENLDSIVEGGVSDDTQNFDEPAVPVDEIEPSEELVANEDTATENQLESSALDEVNDTEVTPAADLQQDGEIPVEAPDDETLAPLDSEEKPNEDDGNEPDANNTTLLEADVVDTPIERDGDAAAEEDVADLSSTNEASEFLETNEDGETDNVVEEVAGAVGDGGVIAETNAPIDGKAEDSVLKIEPNEEEVNEADENEQIGDAKEDAGQTDENPSDNVEIDNKEGNEDAEGENADNDAGAGEGSNDDTVDAITEMAIVSEDVQDIEQNEPNEEDVTPSLPEGEDAEALVASDEPNDVNDAEGETDNNLESSQNQDVELTSENSPDLLDDTADGEPQTRHKRELLAPDGESAMLDQTANIDNEDEGAKDEEEEIWLKLQKDIELEEKEQELQTQTADIEASSATPNEENAEPPPEDLSVEQENSEVRHTEEDAGSLLEERADSTMPQEEGTEEVTEALAVVTETIAKVAMFMIDTPQSPTNQSNDGTGEPHGSDEAVEQQEAPENLDESENIADIKEEFMSNGEEVENVQLLQSFEIQTADDNLAPTNSGKDADEETNQPEDADKSAEEAPKESSAEETDGSRGPEEVFELYVASNETTNDGLVESIWQPDTQLDDSNQPYTHVGKTKSEKDDEGVNYEAAATKLQASYRGHRERSKLRHTNKDSDTQITVVLQSNLVQDAQRDNLPLSHVGEASEKNDEDINYEAAATKIQASYRGHRERSKLKRSNNDGDTPNSVVPQSNLLEEAQHDHVDQTFSGEAKSEKDNEGINYEAAATKIQASYRGHRERSKLKRCNHSGDAQISGVPQSKLAIESDLDDQLLCDSSEAMRISSPLSEVDEGDANSKNRHDSLEEQNLAATKIQAQYRGFSERKRLGRRSGNNSGAEKKVKPEELKRSNSTENLNSAATTIQANYRGYRDRKSLRNRVVKEDAGNGIKEDNHGYRRCRSVEAQNADVALAGSQGFHDEKHRLLADPSDIETAAAITIQATYRGFHAREKMKQERQQRGTSKTSSNRGEADESSDEFEKQNAAAVKIQAGYRGFRTRQGLQQHSGNKSDSNQQRSLSRLSCSGSMDAPQESSVRRSSDPVPDLNNHDSNPTK